MKTISQMKEQIYEDLVNSGQFHSMQAQLKAYVYDLIEKEYNNGKSKLNFQYEHPQLSKLKKFPLSTSFPNEASFCMDLIQQFLESFKFKHTLNVFKKEINRNVTINRSHLAQSFKIEIKNPDSQSVLLSMVQQMVTGDIGAMKSEIKVNNFVDAAKTADRTNHFMNQSNKSNEKKNEPPPKQPEPSFKKPTQNNSNSNINSSNNGSSNIDSSLNSNFNSASGPTPKSDSNDTSSIRVETSKEQPSKVEEPPKAQEDDKKKKGGKDSKKKPVVDKEKLPERASDLLVDVVGKFAGMIKKDKQKEKNQIFEAKRAFSEEKEKKVVDPSESGANKIRGISMGKTVPSFMNKFMTQQQQPQKNDSYVDQQLDEFQQSKDSTRKNPLFSSSQSGFDKSGFDHSVDSNAIQDYQYVERAKKISKKL